MIRLSQTLVFPPTFLGGLVTKLGLTIVTPLTVAHQAPLPIEFPRQEYWSGLLFPSPGDLPYEGTEPTDPALAGRWVLYHCATRKPSLLLLQLNNERINNIFTELLGTDIVLKADLL